MSPDFPQTRRLRKEWRQTGRKGLIISGKIRRLQEIPRSGGD
jgi:hypothetical protein